MDIKTEMPATGLAAIAEAAKSSTAATVVVTATAEPEKSATAKTADASAAATVQPPKPQPEASTDAAATERTRIAAIVNAPEAKNRTELARQLAFGTSMSAAEAIKLMAGTPEIKTSRLDGAVPNPKVDAVDDASASSTAGLAAAVKRQIERATASRAKH